MNRRELTRNALGLVALAALPAAEAIRSTRVRDITDDMCEMMEGKSFVYIGKSDWYSGKLKPGEVYEVTQVYTGVRHPSQEQGHRNTAIAFLKGHSDPFSMFEWYDSFAHHVPSRTRTDSTGTGLIGS